MAIGMTKIKNLIKREGLNVDTELHNNRVNGVLEGCFGFLIDKETGRVIYISTTSFTGMILYRAARDTKDFSSGVNQYTDLKNFGKDIRGLLRQLDWRSPHGYK